MINGGDLLLELEGLMAETFSLVFTSTNIQTDDETQPHHQQQDLDLIDSDEIPPPQKKSNEDSQLWTPPFSFGLHPCVKPTPKYKESSESDHYITVRSNGGLNQMRLEYQ